jgi:hypothetical protein
LKLVVDQQVVAHLIRRNNINVGIFEKNQRNYYPCANYWKKMKNNCLVQIILGALPNSYKSFIQGVISHDEMMIFDKCF